MWANNSPNSERVNIICGKLVLAFTLLLKVHWPQNSAEAYVQIAILLWLWDEGMCHFGWQPSWNRITATIRKFRCSKLQMKRSIRLCNMRLFATVKIRWFLPKCCFRNIELLYHQSNFPDDNFVKIEYVKTRYLLQFIMLQTLSSTRLNFKNICLKWDRLRLYYKTL